MQSAAEAPSLVQEAWKLFLFFSLSCLLLEALHANQRKIDNLDYLLYTLKTTPRSS